MDVFHTQPADAILHSSGWARLPSGVEVLCLPLIDAPSGLFARLSYAEARTLASTMGAELITMAVAKEVFDSGFQTHPVTLVHKDSDFALMRGRAFCERHDKEVLAQLATWDRKLPVANAGKDWIAGAKPGKSRNGGWFKDDGVPIQSGTASSEAHEDSYTDYSQLTRFMRGVAAAVGGATHGGTLRHTLRVGSPHRADVAAWQAIVGTTADGYFGPNTEKLTKVWQAAHGLVADGVVGPASWRAAGEAPLLATATPGRPAVAPACRQALTDANSRWPTRGKASDGILGDPAHQARHSDHNVGNAVDITHDPKSGCTGDVISEHAIQDPRVTYVIWNGQIWNRSLHDTAWRPYSGPNPHTHHVHISVRDEARDDTTPWAWRTP